LCVYKEGSWDKTAIPPPPIYLIPPQKNNSPTEKFKKKTPSNKRGKKSAEDNVLKGRLNKQTNKQTYFLLAPKFCFNFC